MFRILIRNSRTGLKPLVRQAVQACGHVLVDLLNSQNRSIARPEDLGKVFQKVVTQWDKVFRYLIPQQDREALAVLAEGGHHGLDEARLAEYRWHLILDPNNQIQVPLLGLWLKHCIG